ncbi:MAG TPA: dTMP kinase [Candidatus Dormibacteraeota bacterium]|nr:dTMP kinase [Candidatus Dormibacteraeota bacterium]
MNDEPEGALTVQRSSFIVPRSEMFITFEGIDGSGKSTQLLRVAELLPGAVTTKEPGGTPLADRIRAILLDSGSTIDPLAEVLLFAASRRQHTIEVIKPALARGAIVLCDRFTDATLAYQGFGRLLELDRLRLLNDWATDAVRPDVTLIYDLPEETGLTRARSRNAGAAADEGRFETEDLRFYRRVREGYLALAESDRRYAVIDARGSIDEVFARTRAVLEQREVLR